MRKAGAGAGGYTLCNVFVFNNMLEELSQTSLGRSVLSPVDMHQLFSFQALCSHTPPFLAQGKLLGCFHSRSIWSTLNGPESISGDGPLSDTSDVAGAHNLAPPEVNLRSVCLCKIGFYGGM